MNAYTADVLRNSRRERLNSVHRIERRIVDLEEELRVAKDERGALKDHLTQIESDLLGAGERFDD